jgi:hypothetical protein
MEHAHGVGVIERAFQVAADCGSIAEVRRRLSREGYLQVEAHTGGRQIKHEIRMRLDPQLRALELGR